MNSTIVKRAAEDAATAARLTRDLPSFVRDTLDPETARMRAMSRLATRDQRFLDGLERAVYRNRASPYLALLRHAGCELGDARSLVATEGLEGALSVLAGRGVCVTYDELKGRREVVRGSLRTTLRLSDFLNPLVRPHFVTHSGGSGGRPSRTPVSLPYVDEYAEVLATTFGAHAVTSPTIAFWWPVAVLGIIAIAKLGHPMAGWFYPVHPLPRLVHVAAHYLAFLGSLSGHRFPLPERFDLDQPERVVDWMHGQLRTRRPLVMWTTASAGLRIGIAAAARGFDLSGAVLLVGSEAVTDTRYRQMASTGARVIVGYGTTELPRLGNSCATPTHADDVHVMTGQYAMVTRQRPVVDGGPVVHALLATSLSPATPMNALNLELGDTARVEERDCGCPFGAMGMRMHLSDIRSFEKLTGEGVSFARSNLEHILEVVLPARFGGAALDYQLGEVESPDGSTSLVLRISPMVGPVDESAVRDALLTELGRGGAVDRYQADMWRHVGTIQIRRETPVATRAGKVLPLQARPRPD